MNDRSLQLSNFQTILKPSKVHPCQFYDKNTLLTLLEYGFIIIVYGTIHYLKMNLQLNMEFGKLE